MCRNIKPLFNFDPPATEAEIHDAALQFVRKLSGFTAPSQRNEEPFDRAVKKIAAAAAELLDLDGDETAAQGSRGGGDQGARPLGIALRETTFDRFRIDSAAIAPIHHRFSCWM